MTRGYSTAQFGNGKQRCSVHESFSPTCYIAFKMTPNVCRACEWLCTVKYTLEWINNKLRIITDNQSPSEPEYKE